MYSCTPHLKNSKVLYTSDNKQKKNVFNIEMTKFTKHNKGFWIMDVDKIPCFPRLDGYC